MTKFNEIGRDCVALCAEYLYPHEMFPYVAQGPNDHDDVTALQSVYESLWGKWEVSLSLCNYEGINSKEKVENFYRGLSKTASGLLSQIGKNHSISEEDPPLVQYHAIYLLLTNDSTTAFEGMRLASSSNSCVYKLFIEGYLGAQNLEVGDPAKNSLQSIANCKSSHDPNPIRQEIAFRIRLEFRQRGWAFEEVIHDENFGFF